MMEVCTSGFAEHRSDDWPARIDGNTKRRRFFSLDAKVFSTKWYSWFPNEDSLRILLQGAKVCVNSARGKVPECVQNNEDSYARIRKSYHKTTAKDKFSFHCRNSMTPSTN
jgi:hypothetical protein